MAYTTITNGQLPDADVVMGNFEVVRKIPDTTYTGNGLDTTSSGTTTDNHTLQVTGGVIDTGVWIKVLCGGICRSGGSAGDAADVSLKIEVDETSQGSLTTIFNRTLKSDTNSGMSGGGAYTRQIDFYYAPTAGEKSNGLDIKFTSTCSESGSGESSFVNIQINILTD